MATSTNTGTSSTSVSASDLTNLMLRRRKSSYPTDARAERQYWVRQIQSMLNPE